MKTQTFSITTQMGEITEEMVHEWLEEIGHGHKAQVDMDDTTAYNKNWVEELQKENEMLHAENALKLTQILGLEQLLYELRILTMQDNSPCWCGEWTEDGDIQETPYHSKECIKARQATEPFWKGIKT